MNEFINIVDTGTGKQVQFIDSRYYTNDMVHWFPGVTSILNVVSKGSQFENWLKSVGFNSDQIVQKAMAQGSNVHRAIQDLLNGKEITFGTDEKLNFSRDEWIIISRFIDFYQNFNPVTVAVEQVIVSDKLGFGTQLDYICELNGELWYLDWKTGSIYDSASLQISASIQLWNEKYPQKQIKNGGIVHLESAHRGRDKQGKSIQGVGWKLIPVDGIDKYWEDFKHIKAIWDRKNPDFKPFNQQFPVNYKL